jgi:hypothetical protein
MTLALQWRFKTWQRGDKIRDPIQGEFFATDAIHNPAQALVREAVQNSLDAGVERPVHVRFFVSGSTGAVPASQTARFLVGAAPHLQSPGNGLRDTPDLDGPCPFIVCEDFATRGLDGDPRQWAEVPGVKNDFYYFFRTEGTTAKSAEDRGRWGIGKYVFPRSSRINSIWGLTVRRDRRRLLMGQAVLKSHTIGDHYFRPDGSFGTDDDGLTVPLEDPETLNAFCKAFQLTRTLQPGLSVVVPWPDDEITMQTIVEACVTDYFYAILTGGLTIEVESPSDKITLTETTLVQELEQLGPQLHAALRKHIELAIWRQTVSDSEIVEIENGVPEHSHKWADQPLPPERVSDLKARLQEGRPLAFGVKMWVIPKKGDPQESRFEILLARDENETTGRPMFIREGIIVSDVRPASRARGTRALVVVSRSPLASLLGDSENPAHTQWQKDSSHFKGKYKYGPSHIDFVTGAAAAIVGAIVGIDDQVDPTALLDFFSLPSPDGQLTSGSGPSSRKKAKPVPPVVPPLPAIRPRIVVTKVAGGFTITKSAGAPSRPATIDVRAAYDVRRGNPFSRYRSQDFVFGSKPISMRATGAEFAKVGKNRLIVKVLTDDFSLVVEGFDPNRDLIVRATSAGDGQ